MSNTHQTSSKEQVNETVARGLQPTEDENKSNDRVASALSSKISAESSDAFSLRDYSAKGEVASRSTSPEFSRANHPKDLKKFLSGFRRFQEKYFAQNHGNLFSQLKDKQAPKTLLIGCCDSRCDPAIITDCEPGDLFVVRNVANIIAPYGPDSNLHGVSAAIEFAVKALEVESIVVMGHIHCGGISALYTGKMNDPEFEFIGPWMKLGQRALDTTKEFYHSKPESVQLRALERAMVLLSLENALTYPWIKDRVLSGKLSLNGWYFDFETGHLETFNPISHTFETASLAESTMRSSFFSLLDLKKATSETVHSTHDLS